MDLSHYKSEDGKYLIIYNYQKENSNFNYVDLVAHLDTVPVDNYNKWFKQNPFSGETDDTFLYGRGSVDDKIAITISLFLFKMFRELGIKLNYNLRCFVGGDEETVQMSQIDYLNRFPTSDLSIIIDGTFPIAYGEKSISNFDLVIETNTKNNIIYDIKSSNTINMVPVFCSCVIKMNYDFLKDKFNNFLDERSLTGNISIFSENEYWSELKIDGISTHAISNIKGKNPISFMFLFLSEISENCNLARFGKKILHENFFGKQFNIYKYSDKHDTGTNFNFGYIKMKKNKIKLGFNIRFIGDVISQINIENEINSVCEFWFENKFKLVNLSMTKGFVHDIENKPEILLFHKVYQKVNNDYKNKPLFLAGGTYAKHFKNGFCFGPILPKYEYHAHCLNEKIVIKNIFNALKIYANCFLTLSENFELLKNNSK